MSSIPDKPNWHETLILQAITMAVIGNGFLVLLASLQNQLMVRTSGRLNDAIVGLPLILGLTLIYLGTLLHRRKRAALLVVIPLYTFLLGSNITQLIHAGGMWHVQAVVRSLLIPGAVVTALVYFRDIFRVKSDIRNFTWSLRLIGLVMSAALVYGVIGFLVFERRDFHQTIGFWQAVHYTVDQFGFTTQEIIVPYTRRAKLFLDSLSTISAGALIYAVISLFQPLRARLIDQSANRLLALQLLQQSSSDSEDFFKLWPQDKTYFFEQSGRAALAYHVHRGVALVVSDPFGAPELFSPLLREFAELCWVNDWLPAYIHVQETYKPLYEAQGLTLQKIGQEAVVNIDQFTEDVVKQKYFRHIANKFHKNGYTSRVLQPPHNSAVIDRLAEVSNSWLSLPGRQERGFMMGYFSEAYLQQCTVLVACDAAGTIQAFINMIPLYQGQEANFDLLRHTSRALTNVNDFLLMSFIEYAKQLGYHSVNLGLCPLAGVKDVGEARSIIGSTLAFMYANGDRFYSFQGLERFKSKYQPVWRNRYTAYRGGVRGFTRSMYALHRTLNRLR